MDWSRVLDYCDVFISCLVSHSDGTHSLQSIHWEDDANVMLNLSRYVPMNNLIVDGLRVNTFSENFHFEVNYSFNYMQHLSWLSPHEKNQWGLRAMWANS